MRSQKHIHAMALAALILAAPSVSLAKSVTTTGAGGPPINCPVGNQTYGRDYVYAWVSQSGKGKSGETMCMTCQAERTWSPAKECKPGPDTKILPDPTPKKDH